MIVNYIKKWGKDGTCYSQTIKIDKWIAEEFNILLNNKKIEIDNNFLKNHCYSDNDLKIKSIDFLWQGTNYTNLIHLDIFLELINILNKKGYNFDFKRLLYRNTIIEVI